LHNTLSKTVPIVQTRHDTTHDSSSPNIHPASSPATSPAVAAVSAAEDAGEGGRHRHPFVAAFLRSAPSFALASPLFVTPARPPRSVRRAIPSSRSDPTHAWSGTREGSIHPVISLDWS
jgi:hypothetical protein